MTGSITIIIIEWRSDDKRSTIGRYAHGPTKLITGCFPVDIGPDLVVASHGRTELVDSNLTREATISVVGWRSDNKGDTIGGYAHRMTKPIIVGFSKYSRSYGLIGKRTNCMYIYILYTYNMAVTVRWLETGIYGYIHQTSLAIIETYPQ